MALRDSQLTELREFEVRQIANVLGVPPHKLGTRRVSPTTPSNRSSRRTLTSRSGRGSYGWETECGMKLLTDAEHDAGYDLEFNRGTLVQADLSTKHRSYREAILGDWRSVNEEWALENLPSIGLAGDVYMLPLNMTPADKFGQLPQQLAGDEGTREVFEVMRLWRSPENQESGMYRIRTGFSGRASERRRVRKSCVQP